MENVVSVVLFEGGEPSGEIEQMMTSVRHAVLMDNIEKMRQVAWIGPIYLLTNYPRLAEEAEPLGVKVIENRLSEKQFHFGKIFSELINKEKLEKVFYMGGASIPLVTVKEIEEICLLLLNSEAIIYANNAQSADIIAFTPGNLINKIEPPEIDNILGFALRDGTGVRQELFRHTSGLLFDLDTPADLLVLAGSPLTGPRTRRVLDSLDLDLSRLQAAKEVLRGDYEEVVLLGRVGAPIIAHINQNLKVRLRVFSEERGMKALGREKRGEALSLMGFFLEKVGTEKFVGYLEKVAKCAFLDTRVLMAHFKLGLSAEERFLSDLGRWQELKNPIIREFIKATAESCIPIVCGAHSLVLGGLWAIVDEIGPTHDHWQKKCRG
ncbi:MAG: hypothetical protein GX996_10795 [Firmicutes bacterium]|nr:hypothetical protein [Bacillota bacterium]